jgi:hypothetical protein
MSAIDREKIQWKAESEMFKDKYNKELETTANYKN